jgi:hypothetical protein
MWAQGRVAARDCTCGRYCVVVVVALSGEVNEQASVCHGYMCVCMCLRAEDVCRKFVSCSYCRNVVFGSTCTHMRVCVMHKGKRNAEQDLYIQVL